MPKDALTTYQTPPHKVVPEIKIADLICKERRRNKQRLQASRHRHRGLFIFDQSGLCLSAAQVHYQNQMRMGSPLRLEGFELSSISTVVHYANEATPIRPGRRIYILPRLGLFSLKCSSQCANRGFSQSTGLDCRKAVNYLLDKSTAPAC
ncbi:hypothetical protein EJ08DRAFT_280426 [Tothia fuscella]|uniref:Uncharacterized protein n=1 Tax=Tothia fuscella TaxID=1048955 RepID=A0A9P4TY30_9PEZI|nr:hypothetical protein EJ08DRAFT_280426 [Tothia fuscella]